GPLYCCQSNMDLPNVIGFVLAQGALEQAMRLFSLTTTAAKCESRGYEEERPRYGRFSETAATLSGG
ncbi:hypothetical protein CSUI_009751, partial [Cystoisospora suis]